MKRLAHDLRQFIPVIWGNIDLLVRERQELAGNHRLANIRKAASLMEEVIGDALKRDQERLGLSMNTIVLELATLSVLQQTLTVRLDLEPDLPALPLETPTTSLHRAIMNLCSNAKHAMQQGVGAKVYDSSGENEGLPRRPEKDGTLTIGTRLLDGDSCVAVFVSDTGPGLGEAEQARLFTRMEGGDAAIENGHGYGLQNVNRLAREMGGRLEIKSAPGAGATFTLIVPLKGVGTVGA